LAAPSAQGQARRAWEAAAAVEQLRVVWADRLVLVFGLSSPAAKPPQNHIGAAVVLAPNGEAGPLWAVVAAHVWATAAVESTHTVAATLCRRTREAEAKRADRIS